MDDDLYEDLWNEIIDYRGCPYCGAQIDETDAACDDCYLRRLELSNDSIQITLTIPSLQDNRGTDAN